MFRMILTINSDYLLNSVIRLEFVLNTYCYYDAMFVGTKFSNIIHIKYVFIWLTLSNTTGEFILICISPGYLLF
jgi:hypothetical protein